MIDVAIKREASPEFDLYGEYSRIQTLEYKTCPVNILPVELHNFFDNNSIMLEDLLDWKLQLKDWLNNQVFPVDAIYPEDAQWKENRLSTINGVVRWEELMTFVTVNPETNEVLYLTRSRPEIKNSNTPWSLDPWVFSHGWLQQAGAINAWRYVADKLWKNDPELTKEEYEVYLSQNPFPQDITVINAWQFLLANGSNARNAKKTTWETLEPRTSAIINVRALVISYTDFQKKVALQNEDSTSEIEYTVTCLDKELDWSATPKHSATHGLLKDRMSEIKTKVQDIQNQYNARVSKTL